MSDSLPEFKYHPDAYENGTFSKKEDGGSVVCECCGLETEFCCETIYCRETIDCLYPGSKAAEHRESFRAEF